MDNCIFCKIIEKEIESTIIDENEHVIVIEDIRPKAPIHYLLIPKIHVVNFYDINVNDKPEHNVAMREMFKMVKKIAHNLPEPKAFTLISNNGKESGQCVFHMHWHLLAGKNLYNTGLKL